MKRDGEEDIQGPRERRERSERRADERRTRQNGTAKQKAGKRAETVWETETGPCLLLLFSLLLPIEYKEKIIFCHCVYPLSQWAKIRKNSVD